MLNDAQLRASSLGPPIVPLGAQGQSKPPPTRRPSVLEKTLTKVKSRLSVGRPMDHILKELLIPPKNRNIESIELLKMATSSISFFKDINSQPKYTTRFIHERLCKQMLHCRLKKGEAAIVKSSSD